MKSFKGIIFAHFLLAAGVGFLIYQAKSDFEVSAGVEIHAVADFDAPLSGDGGWVDVGSYGRCWRPREVAAGWRPYCEGHWMWTDCGWYWASDEPWAWACYHYGTWLDDPSEGWCWVPATEWAPAWVQWRAGEGYIGWAPCAPAGAVVAPGLFAFVAVNHFGDSISRSSVVFNDAAIIRQTAPVGGASPSREQREIGGRRQEVVVNTGPDVATVEKATGRKLTSVSIQDAVRQSPVPKNFQPGSRGGQAPDGVRPASPSETQPNRDGRPLQQPDTRPTVNPANDERQVPPAARQVTPAVPPTERPTETPRHEPATAPTEVRPNSPVLERPSTPLRETVPAPSQSHPTAPPRESAPAAPREEAPPHQEAPPPERGKDQGARPESGGVRRADLAGSLLGMSSI